MEAAVPGQEYLSDNGAFKLRVGAEPVYRYDWRGRRWYVEASAAHQEWWHPVGDVPDLKAAAVKVETWRHWAHIPAPPSDAP